VKFTVISLFPDLISEVLKVGVVGQSIAKQKIFLEALTPRSWTQDVHKTVDDRPFGGGDGMVLMAEPLSRCIEDVLQKSSSNPLAPPPRKIFLSPQGRKLTHEFVMELAQEQHLILLCGRYAGVDQRLLNQYNFEELSIGDYVLSGGDLAALVVIEAVARQIPGVLGHEASSSQDSFAGDGLLEAPCYTRPREWREQNVPEFLLTGNHSQICEDRWFLGVVVTFVKRRDLFDAYIERQAVKKKVWQRSFDKLAALPNNELTSLGLARKNLEDFEKQVRQLKIF
jgi:tRNA (guanine37-N1)-methyltransferase